MANKPKIFKTKFNEDGSAYVMARAMRKNSSQNLVALVPADVSSVVRRVFTTSDGAVVIGPTTLTVSDVILGSLSTGTIWTVDTTGFNFVDTVPATAFPDGDTEYQIEYKITLTGGEVFWLLVSGTSLAVLTS